MSQTILLLLQMFKIKKLSLPQTNFCLLGQYNKSKKQAAFKFKLPFPVLNCS